MKRFLIFKGAIHYPAGGMDDFVLDVDTEVGAKELVDKDFEECQHKSHYWWNVYDQQERREVYEK